MRFPLAVFPLTRIWAYVGETGGVESTEQSHERKFRVTLFFLGTKMRAMRGIGVFIFIYFY